MNVSKCVLVVDAGAIPRELGGLPALRRLEVHGNGLTGERTRSGDYMPIATAVFTPCHVTTVRAIHGVLDYELPVVCCRRHVKHQVLSRSSRP